MSNIFTKILTMIVINFPSILSLTRVPTTSITVMVTCNPQTTLNPFLNMYLNLPLGEEQRIIYRREMNNVLIRKRATVTRVHTDDD